MEDSEFNPQEKNQIESKSVSDNDNDNDNKIDSNNKREEISENQDLSTGSDNSRSKNLKSDSVNSISQKNSLFKRIIENGFDGITTNPNYKLLALLIILLINLSLFFLIGNLGKSFLKSSGILS